MSVYIAAAYDRRHEMAHVDATLRTLGIHTTSSWIHGCPSAKCSTFDAVQDFEDIDAADHLLAFSGGGTGGRHVELGYALAKGKQVSVIGEPEHIFHRHPGVQCYPDLDAWLDATDGLSAT